MEAYTTRANLGVGWSWLSCQHCSNSAMLAVSSPVLYVALTLCFLNSNVLC